MTDEAVPNTATTCDPSGDEHNRGLPVLFSSQLEQWLRRDQPASLGDLLDRFGHRSFAILFVVLMAVPAVPLPTGGVTHVVEVVTMLLALELAAGRTNVWMPRRWEATRLRGVTGPRFSAVLLRRIRQVERLSRPRLGRVLETRPSHMLYGAVVFVLALTAFLAPPFSGLDTLPALGVVVLSLGFIFGDVVIVAVGTAIGALGLGFVVGIGRGLMQLL